MPTPSLSLHIDCRAGMAGDMFLAAFAHLGLDLAPLESMFRAAKIDVSITVHADNRAAGTGRRVDICAATAQPLRHLPECIAVITKLDCSPWVRERAIAAMTQLATAEAEVHGCAVGDIHFHEVGAVDTLVDVVGAFWAMQSLGIAHVTATPLPWFSGTVECEHGSIPLPAPATVVLMRGLPVFATNETTEITTPTGALIGKCLLEALATSASIGDAFSGPHGEIIACGTGYGTRPAPRGLRLLLLRAPKIDTTEKHSQSLCSKTLSVADGLYCEHIVQLETHLDHLTGEELAHAMESLMNAGAQDVLWLPGIMKKGRPGGALRVLCREEDTETLRAALFRHTHTLGIRQSHQERVILPRQESTVIVDGTPLTAKSYSIDTMQYHRPEHDALAARARKLGTSVIGLRCGLYKKHTPSA